MEAESLDDVDRGILYLLQDDARSHTTVEIGEKVGVSSSTVANRIASLEERGVITGYQPTLDYQETDVRYHMLAIGTVPFEDQADIVEESMTVSGVVSARELLTSEENVEIEFIGRTREEVEATLADIDDVGVTVERVEIVKRTRRQPYNHYGEQYTTSAEDG